MFSMIQYACNFDFFNIYRKNAFLLKGEEIHFQNALRAVLSDERAIFTLMTVYTYQGL